MPAPILYEKLFSLRPIFSVLILPWAAWLKKCASRRSASSRSASELIMRLIVVVIVVVPTSCAAAGALVVLLDDRRADALDLLLLLLDLLRVGLRVAREPVLPILDGVVDGLLLILVHLLAETLVVARSF